MHLSAYRLNLIKMTKKYRHRYGKKGKQSVGGCTHVQRDKKKTEAEPQRFLSTEESHLHKEKGWCKFVLVWKASGQDLLHISTVKWHWHNSAGLPAVAKAGSQDTSPNTLGHPRCQSDTPMSLHICYFCYSGQLNWASTGMHPRAITKYHP